MWNKILASTHNYSRAARVKEINYKLVTRWHLTPAKLKRVFPESSDLCWRCGQDRGTQGHIWYRCAALMEYWGQILKTIAEITPSKINEEDLLLILLSLVRGKDRILSDSLTLHLSMQLELQSPDTGKSWLPQRMSNGCGQLKKLGSWKR